MTMCNGDHAAPACPDPQCWLSPPISPKIDAGMIMFRAPDGEAVYLDETEATAFARDLLSLVIDLQIERSLSR